MENMLIAENVNEMKSDDEMKGDEMKGGKMNDASGSLRAERSIPPRSEDNKSSDASNTEETSKENDGQGTAIKEDATTKEDATIKAKRKCILGNTQLIGSFFQRLYGTQEWAALDAAPSYRSGPVPKSQGGLAMRRMTDPMARFYVAVTMAEAALLVRCVAHDADERDQLNVEIDRVLGLSTAVAAGRIQGFTICWPNGRYPKTATKIRILAAPGQRTRSQVLGTLDGELRKFVDAVMAAPYVAVRIDKTAQIVNGRLSGRQ